MIPSSYSALQVAVFTVSMVLVWPISLPTLDQALLTMSPNTKYVLLCQALSLTGHVFSPSLGASSLDPFYFSGLSRAYEQFLC